MGLGMKKFPPPPLSQNSDLGKKGGHPKSGKNSTNSDLAENFRITPGLRKNGIGNENFYLPFSQKLILGKKKGGTPNQAKNQPNSDFG